MQTVILSHAGHATGPSNSAIRYSTLTGGVSSTSWATTIASANATMPIAGTFGNIRANFPVTITTGSFELALMVNSVAVLTGAITTGNSLVLAGTAAVAAGDVVCWRVTPTSTPDAQTNIQIGCTFDATTAGKSVIFSYIAGGTTAGYSPISGASGASLTEVATKNTMPTGGVINDLYIRLSIAPGTTTTRTFTVYKGGVATTLTATVASGDTTASITGQAVSFAAGDIVVIRQELNAGVPASSTCIITTDWVPTISGESVVFGNVRQAQSAASATFINVNGLSSNGSGVSSASYNIAPVAFALRKLYAETDVATGAAKSRTIQFQIAGATQALPSAAITNATTANDTTNSLSIAQGDFINVVNTPSGTPTANTAMAVSAVAYIAPAVIAGGGGQGRLSMSVGIGL